MNEEAGAIIKKFKIPAKGSLDEKDVQLRLAGRMVNEALLCLQEGILAKPVCIITWLVLFIVFSCLPLASRKIPVFMEKLLVICIILPLAGYVIYIMS